MGLKPGSSISENMLAEKFGVSRTPVRETIARLVALGLAEVRPQRGTFVTKLSVAKVLEARFIREALEVAIIRNCAEFSSPELILECEMLIKKQELAAERHDAMAFQKLDDAFHQTFADFTNFQRAASLIHYEKAHMDRVRNLSLKEFGGQYESVLAQHKAILAAVKDKLPEAASEAMSRHLHLILKVIDDVASKHPEYFD